MNRIAERGAVFALALGLAGCATEMPQPLMPKFVPESFTGPLAPQARIWPQAAWWQDFASPELSDLIAQGQANNVDLAMAAARVMGAQAQADVQRSALFPQLGFRVGTQSAGGNPYTVDALGQGGSSYATGTYYNLTYGASYQIDFWGLARDNLRAADQTLKSSRFARDVVALTVTAGIARDYVDILALRNRVAIARDEIAAIKGILDIIRLKVSTGTSSRLDLVREQAQAESAEAELSNLEEQEQEARFALALLLGRAPEGFDIMARDLETLSIPAIAPGLPSHLLRRRPDVAEAEANLASAHANLDAARAAFLPQIRLTEDGGVASTAVTLLLHGSNYAWAYGANLLQTIFDGGKRYAQQDAAEASQLQFVAAYRATVLRALSDVETALGQVANGGVAADHLEQEVIAARETFRISQLQFRQGATDLLTVLQAQQTLFSAQERLTAANQARILGMVHLYEALGGGWVADQADQAQAGFIPAARLATSLQADSFH